LASDFKIQKPAGAEGLVIQRSKPKYEPLIVPTLTALGPKSSPKGNGNGPDLARLAKDSRNNVRDCLMRLEVELMAL
jgi:hypothetical protein